MAYELLEALMPYMKLYEEEQAHGKVELASFASWLQQRIQTRQEHSSAPNEQVLNGRISQHIGVLYKHAKGYMKKAFEGSRLSSVDDFAYLATLWQEGSMRKTELIHFNIGEVSSGMEVIKRLQKHGLLHDFADPEDRRSRRVQLSETGKAELLRVMKKMQLVSEIVAGSLSLEERSSLLYMLEKLSALHLKIYQEKREEGLEEISEWVIGG